MLLKKRKFSNFIKDISNNESFDNIHRIPEIKSNLLFRVGNSNDDIKEKVYL